MAASPGIRATAISLNAWRLVPEDRVGEIMHDPAMVAGAPVWNLDETGFRVGGKTQWLHNASTAALTHYRVAEKRGALFDGLAGGIIVHDHFKPYFTLEGVEDALCNAHHCAN